ncbi:MAG TPA: hypothetical protein VGF67_23205 [Ktedonobacteraceae bacterium]
MHSFPVLLCFCEQDWQTLASGYSYVSGASSDGRESTQRTIGNGAERCS